MEVICFWTSSPLGDTHYLLSLITIIRESLFQIFLVHHIREIFTLLNPNDDKYQDFKNLLKS